MVISRGNSPLLSTRGLSSERAQLAAAVRKTRPSDPHGVRVGRKRAVGPGKGFQPPPPTDTVTLLRGLGAVAAATGDRAIDWDAVVDASMAATAPGSVEIDRAGRRGFAADVREARDAIGDVTSLSFSVPRTVEVQNRHHWIEANVTTFRRVLAPLSDAPTFFPGLARRMNTATMATMLTVLGRNVLGQYDPVLFGEGDPQLYFVYPNLRGAATTLDVDYERFRRWIAFHEVTHAAEFGAAPWLTGHLEDRIGRAIDALAHSELDAGAVRDVDATMTVIEGYAEFVMDRAFDESVADLREKLDARRRGGGPFAIVVRRLLGLGIKRRQYERGRRFFDEVAGSRDLDAAGAVWERPENLPTPSELRRPADWIARVDP